MEANEEVIYLLVNNHFKILYSPVLQPFMSFGLLDHNFTKAVTREE
jgi:hypothetical protein